jgi:DNA-directed RNA polymerase subunit L
MTLKGLILFSSRIITMSLEDLKKVLLSDPEVKKAYEAEKPVFDRAKIKIRKKRRIKKDS